ncbi:histone deacetylase [Thraustotheca clavata]|uniref:Histone deacetylase n=1 Tax=Thraustotheca clavata TaxID=74557 RepID=A0A1W0ABG1_9STRA|nr:histone deacetylase [Thraustotheca clavata]
MANVSISKPRKRLPVTPGVFLMDDYDASTKKHNHEASPDAALAFSTPSSCSTKSSSITRNLLSRLKEEDYTTLVVCQPICMDHHTGGHQENRRRMAEICGPNGILLKPRFNHLRWAELDQLKSARICDLSRVHSLEYLMHIERVCMGLPQQNSDLNLENHFVAGQSYKEWLKTDATMKYFAESDYPALGKLDHDTALSSESFKSALLAVGAVLHAVDKVVQGDNRNAFVVIRPPGHHAGPYGCVENDAFHEAPDTCSNGFCLLNNVAIAAAYAMSNYSTSYYSAGVSPFAEIRRVAIVDFDIHHGNGTEEIIRNLYPHYHRYPLPASWAPKSFHSYMPWRDSQDAQNVYFASLHLHDDQVPFYPGSGKGPHGQHDLANAENIVNIPLKRLIPHGKSPSDCSTKIRKTFIEQASEEFRLKASSILFPSLLAFNPDLILISAGFDGHVDDYYHFLTEWDYEWITEKLVDIADECCCGRIVSVLEGGYNLQSHNAGKTSNIMLGANFHQAVLDTEMLDYGALARSCAAHVTALSSN